MVYSTFPPGVFFKTIFLLLNLECLSVVKERVGGGIEGLRLCNHRGISQKGKCQQTRQRKNLRFAFI